MVVAGNHNKKYKIKKIETFIGKRKTSRGKSQHEVQNRENLEVFQEKEISRGNSQQDVQNRKSGRSST